MGQRAGFRSQLMLCVAVQLALACGASAQEAPAIAIVFDGSGSMWGKLEGEKATKLVLGREAVAAALDKLDGKIRTGLVTFGRRRGDCADVEVVVKPDAVGSERIKEQLEKANPKGRGPVVLATREAAKALGTTRPASVVLIHDDLDNCQQDACAAGAELKRDYPGLKVNVVSLGMKKEDLSRIACLAEATGGRHFDAQSGAQIAAHITEAVSGTSSAPAVGAIAQPVRPPPVPVPVARSALASIDKSSAVSAVPRKPTPTPAGGPPGLWLASVLAADGPLVTEPVSWRIMRKDRNPEATVFEAQASEARAPLQPGSYVVEARYGLISKRQTFEVVPARPTAAVVTLDAGALRFAARAQAAGPTIDQVTFTVYSAADSSGRPGEPVWIGVDPPSAVGLPPGTYKVVAERGFAQGEQILTVSAGAIADVDIALGASLLTLKLAAREDGDALPGAIFIVAADDPSQLQGRRELIRSAALQPDFVLPAGSYTITTRVGDAEARDRIALGAGESVKRTIIFGLGRLALSAKAEQVASLPPLREPISFRIMRKDAEGREVARAVVSPHAVELPAGSYRVEAVVGNHNARAARDVELAVGRTIQLSLDVPAARLGLKLDPDMGRGEPSWEVRDDAGNVVARSTALEPQLVLAPGRYSVRATVRDRQGEEDVVLRIGESRVVTVESN